MHLTRTRRRALRVLRRLGTATVTAALVASFVPASAWASSPPNHRPLRPLYRDGGVPVMFTDVRDATSPYYIVLYHWTPYVTNPAASRPSTRELNRFKRPWSAPLVTYADGSIRENPVATAQHGIGDYTRFLATGDRRFLTYTLKSADWLVQRQSADGSWRYDFAFGDLQPGWASAMTQGTAISLLVRAWGETGRRRYLDAARRAYDFMMRPVPEGGTLGTLDDGTPFLELYPNSVTYAHVLNGAIFAAWGARDLWLATGDSRSYRAWVNLNRGIRRHVKGFDLGDWSSYTINSPRRASAMYHRVHIAQLRVLGSITRDSGYVAYADRFYAGLLAMAP